MYAKMHRWDLHAHLAPISPEMCTFAEKQSGHMKNTITEEKKWTILESEYLIKRPWLTARRDVAQLPDGRINHEYYVLEYPDWVNIIAITEDGDFVLERQYRHALGNTCYELPCGVIEEGETPLQAAQRELSLSKLISCSGCFGAMNISKILKK